MQARRFTIFTKNRILKVWLVSLIAAAVFVTVAAQAAGDAKTGTADTKAENEPIQITADQLISNNEEKFAEFSGNVKVVQGTFVINSDKLRIYYQGDLLNTEKQRSEEELLKRIVATGNVKIVSDQYSAETDKVEYDTAAMTIILTGENSKVISGKNSLIGSKITLYRRDGRVKVERGKSNRIKALFYTDSKTSNAFKIEKPKQQDTQSKTTP